MTECHQTVGQSSDIGAKQVQLSIVIPTCNRPRELHKLLQILSMQKGRIARCDMEVIVSDDGIAEHTQQLCRYEYPWVVYAKGPQRGPAANRNSGAAIAVHPWLVFLDDDCLPGQRFLSAYVDALSQRSADEMFVLQGPTLREETPTSLLWESPHNPDGLVHISANFGIGFKAFVNAGKFDERFPSAAIEDTEFFSRFQLKGGRVEFLPEAVVRHPLRPIAKAKNLANRWEGKVIWALDQGAPPASIAWRLPWHVFRVVQSRFRGAKLSFDNLRAAFLFALEVLFVVAKTVGWVRKWSSREPSKFWREQTDRFGPPPKYGF